jgi:hypothetical protein
MRILANFLLTLCLLGICEAGQEVVQYAKTRNVSTLSEEVDHRRTRAWSQIASSMIRRVSKWLLKH